MTFNLVISKDFAAHRKIGKHEAPLILTKTFACHQELFFPTTQEEQHVTNSFAYTPDNLSKYLYLFCRTISNVDSLVCLLDSEIFRKSTWTIWVMFVLFFPWISTVF